MTKGSAGVPQRGALGVRGSVHVRLRVIMIGIMILFSIFGMKLFQLQGLDPKDYAVRATSSGLQNVTLPAERGEILDRDGVPLAQTVAGSKVIADPVTTAPMADEIAEILARRLGLDYFDLLTALSQDTRSGDKPIRYAVLARRVPASDAADALAALAKAKLKGVYTESDPIREYPAGDVAANLLGFLNTDGEPLGGLEQSFNTLLQGKDGRETFEVGGGNRIPLGENSKVAPVDGRNVRLTIDRDVQWYTQRVLRNAVEKASAESGAAVVLDSRTGDVLALADYPTYDANKPGEAPESDRGARSVSNVYEPGSVEKVLTSAALIDARKVSPETRITVPSQLPVMDRIINDYFEHPTLRMTLAGVIAKSSNIGTVIAARQMSHGQLWNYLDAFGLGQRPNLGLPSQTKGLLPPASQWTDLTRATVSFGQGVSVSAIQMAAAVNAIANGGEYVAPSLVQGRLTTDSGATVGNQAATRSRVVSAEAARKTAHMMELVTTRGVGTAPNTAIPGYRVAGKTGTAQQVGATCGCYDGSVAVSFAGFAPADDPRFTVYVVIQRPQRTGSAGGVTAGPVFRSVMGYLLQKYAVPPTGAAPAKIPVQW